MDGKTLPRLDMSAPLPTANTETTDIPGWGVSVVLRPLTGDDWDKVASLPPKPTDRQVANQQAHFISLALEEPAATQQDLLELRKSRPMKGWEELYAAVMALGQPTKEDQAAAVEGFQEEAA